ncbi:MAG: hypothetical protein GX581_01265 [Syntrophomonadaceae bacterium]|nr:hypothetical protein [Syntrophomonadaceae bacterium]
MSLMLAVSILGIYFVIRNIRVRKIESELALPLEMSEAEKTQFAVFMEKWGLATGVAGITSIEAIYSLSLIDENVLKAIDFSYNADISKFRDLTRFIETNLGPGDGLVGSLSRIQGYTAERVVAMNLISQGHVVEFPESASQRGFDLLVDGHRFQVKNTLTPNIIHKHIETYPEIPVIVNSEMGAYFVDNPMVLVDPELSNAQIKAMVQNTIDGADLLDSAATHIPFITLGLSSFKEAKLMVERKTDITTAGKHVVYDTASIGLGGAGGAKLGTLIGSVLGPAGAGAGLIVGSIIGTLSGRYFANKIKRLKLNKKQDELDNALIEVGNILTTVIDKKRNLLSQKKNRVVNATKVPWWNFVWPSRKAYIVRGLEKKYLQAIAYLDEFKKNLLSLDSLQAGKEAYKTVAGGGYYDPNLLEAIRKVNLVWEEIQKEMRKLGMA